MYIIPVSKRKYIEAKVLPKFKEEISKLVKQAIEDSYAKYCDSRKQTWFDSVKSYLNSEEDSEYKYEKIIVAKPHKMMEIYKEMMGKYNDSIISDGDTIELFENDGVHKLVSYKTRSLTADEKLFNKQIRFLKEAFPYESKFIDKSVDSSKYDKYSFCEQLRINVCVYCNMQYTYTVVDDSAAAKKGKLVRPELDHYFPKSRYPMFALSLYNLIPSCHMCNSNIKGTRELKLEKHIHPYIDEHDGIDFAYSARKGFRLCENTGDVIKNPKAPATNEFFYMKDIYATQKQSARQIYEKAKMFNAQYFEDTCAMIESKSTKRVNKKKYLEKLFDYVSEDQMFNTSLGQMRHTLQSKIIKRNYGIDMEE